MYWRSRARLAVAFALAILAYPAAARADWVEFDSKEGGFHASFPAAPQRSVDEKKDDKGKAIVVSYNFMAGDQALLCVAGYTDYVPPVDTETELAADRDNFSEAVGAKVSGSRRIAFKRPPQDELPAIDFTSESATHLFRAIFVVDGQRVFQIASAYSRENPAGPAGMKTCIDGFKLAPR